MLVTYNMNCMRDSKSFLHSTNVTHIEIIVFVTQLTERNSFSLAQHHMK